MTRRIAEGRVAPSAWSRVRAVLAAGAVLGVGAVTTLAAWTDDELGTGSFGASVFDIESRTVASGSWASHPSAPGATLTVTSGSAMSPGTSAYAWMDLRTVGGTVTLSGVTGTGTLSPVLVYRMVRLSSASNGTGCDATSFGSGATFLAGGTAAYLSVSTVPGSPVSSPVAAAGGTIGLCIEVQLPAGTASSYQGSSATVTWTFSAISAS